MTRTRSTTEYDITTPHNWYDKDKNGVVLATYNFPSRNKKTKVIIDTVTPGYYEKLSKGEFLPINDVSIKTTVQTQTAGSGTNALKVVPNSGSARQEGEVYYLTVPALPAVTIDTATVDNVVINAIAKAKTADFDVLTFLGEFHDTVRLFRETVSGLTHIGLRVAKKAKQRTDRRILRKHIAELRRRGITWKGKRLPVPPRRAHQTEYVTEFNKQWLKARYGVRPLLYDFNAISSLLSEKHANLLARKAATLSRSLTATATSTETYSSIKYVNTSTRSGSQRYRAVVYYKDNQSRIGANPVITAYELTRLSFVFDWFINVGAWLQAMSPREGYTKLGVSVGVVSDYNDVTTSVVSEGTGHAWSIGQSGSSQTINVMEYTRFPYSGVPLPSINVNLNPFKVLDLIALVVTNRRRIFRVLGFK